ncbi:hypothetical protein [Cellulomonas sp. PS-H5]|uniref:hypothetical protein n=1 Tax=Cellulomonas sp. PS-H5 TaxID=2820400 RepID=UPI001C50021F|nr:hypothetical protein [Cellulomonas sp. PS-H5]MBW0252587.1 hypothetical protein [Cellulomonas sp. PS-H5]
MGTIIVVAGIALLIGLVMGALCRPAERTDPEALRILVEQRIADWRMQQITAQAREAMRRAAEKP